MLELLKSRRSIRRYEDRIIEKEKIDKLLRAALLAPSSRAIRPWEFIAITDREILAELAKCREYSSQFLQGAALGIVVIADKELSDVWIEDSSITAAILHLTAHSMGLGSCWIQVRSRMHNDEKTTEAYIRDVLNIPDKYSVECIVSVGYPAEEKKAYEEKDIKYEKIHFNTF